MPCKLITTATILAVSATFSNAQNVNSNGLSGLVSNTTSPTRAENLNSGAGTAAFDDLVRSAAPDFSTLGATLGQGGDPLSNGASFAQVFCSLHKRFELRTGAPSFSGSNSTRSGSFDPLALN